MYFIAHPQRYIKPARGDKFRPDSRRVEGGTDGAPCMHPTQQRAPLDTWILMGKVQMLTAGEGEVSAASKHSGLTAAEFYLETTH